jgi:hypothetical protein
LEKSNEISIERYKELSTDITKEYNTPEYKAKLYEFNANFDKNVKVYFNEVAKIYLHKFMAYIKYNFFIFKKKDNKYVPAVFNIRELTSIHKPILERINKLIRNELPRIFGISSEENYNQIENYDAVLFANSDMPGLISNPPIVFPIHSFQDEFASALRKAWGLQSGDQINANWCYLLINPKLIESSKDK